MLTDGLLPTIRVPKARPARIRGGIALLSAAAGPLLLLLMPPDGRAAEASFACAEAALADEQIICGDPLLRQADRDLAQHYRALLAGLGEGSRAEALRADERGWILRRDRECEVTRTTRVTKASLPRLADCFLAAYDERAADLAAIAADPARDPAEISQPIRKSRFDVGPGPAPTDRSVATGLVTLAPDRAVLAWRADGSLAMIGRLPGGHRPIGLYAWQAGKGLQPLSDAVADPERIDRLCGLGDSLVLIPRGVAGPPEAAPPLQQLSGGTIELLSRRQPPADLAAACGLERGRLLVGAGSGRPALDLGPVAPTADPADRFVGLRQGGSARPLQPPLRIDRRYGLHAAYLAFADSFVVSPSGPARLDGTAERRWAKTGCFTYWRIAAATGRAERGCLPFGAYVGATPRPLPTAAATYFSAGEAGLFRIEDNAARPVLPGPVDSAAVSPDGCAIAFAGAVDAGTRPRGSRAIRVLDICRPPAEIHAGAGPG